MSAVRATAELPASLPWAWAHAWATIQTPDRPFKFNSNFKRTVTDTEYSTSPRSKA